MTHAGRPCGARYPGEPGAGCTAIITILKHKDLDVQTRISASIFLDPTVVAKKTVWLEITSTANEPMELAARGHVVTPEMMRIACWQPPAPRRSVLYGYRGAGR